MHNPRSINFQNTFSSCTQLQQIANATWAWLFKQYAFPYSYPRRFDNHPHIKNCKSDFQSILFENLMTNGYKWQRRHTMLISKYDKKGFPMYTYIEIEIGAHIHNRICLKNYLNYPLQIINQTFIIHHIIYTILILGAQTLSIGYFFFWGTSCWDTKKP